MQDVRVWSFFVCDYQFMLFIPGSYDHTLKLFDARVDKSVMTMEHGQPVESLLLYPSEGLLVSAGSQRYNHCTQLAHPENVATCCQTEHKFC